MGAVEDGHRLAAVAVVGVGAGTRGAGVVAGLVHTVTVAVEGEARVALTQVVVEGRVASAGLTNRVTRAGGASVGTCQTVAVAVHEVAADAEALSVVEESVALAAEALVAVGTGARSTRVVTVDVGALVAVEGVPSVALALSGDNCGVGGAGETVVGRTRAGGAVGAAGCAGERTSHVEAGVAHTDTTVEVGVGVSALQTGVVVDVAASGARSVAQLAVACSIEGVSGVALAVGSGERCVGLATGTGVRLVGKTGCTLAAAVTAVSVTVEHIAVVTDTLVVVQSR